MQLQHPYIHASEATDEVQIHILSSFLLGPACAWPVTAAGSLPFVHLRLARGSALASMRWPPQLPRPRQHASRPLHTRARALARCSCAAAASGPLASCPAQRRSCLCSYYSLCAASRSCTLDHTGALFGRWTGSGWGPCPQGHRQVHAAEQAIHACSLRAMAAGATPCQAASDSSGFSMRTAGAGGALLSAAAPALACMQSKTFLTLALVCVETCKSANMLLQGVHGPLAGPPSVQIIASDTGPSAQCRQCTEAHDQPQRSTAGQGATIKGLYESICTCNSKVE